MTVLIVEDDPNKLRQVERLIQERFPGLPIDTAESYKTALQKLRRTAPSLLILDMSLPIFEPGDIFGVRTSTFGGRDILDQLKRLHIKVPVIVVTQFETFPRGTETVHRDDLDRELMEEHGDIYRGAVFYRAGYHDWKEHLETLTRRELFREDPK